MAAAGLCRSDLHIMSSAPGAFPYDASVHPRPRDRRTGRGARPRRVGRRGRRPRRRLQPVGLRDLLAMRQRARQRVRAHPASARTARARARRRPRGVRARPVGAIPCARRRARSGCRGAADRRRPDALPRRQAVAPAAATRHAPPSSSAWAGSGIMAVQILKAISPARIVAVDVRERRARARAERPAPTRCSPAMA